MRYKYTDDDILFLKEYYPIGRWDLIKDRFPQLSKNCIYRKCQKMGIKSLNKHRENFDISNNRTPWSNLETQILINNYPYKPMNELLDLLPNRNKNMINSKARSLKLISYTYKVSQWKDDEIEYIKANWEITPDKLMAKKLGKSFRAVKWKRESLGLYRIDFENKSYQNLSKYLRGHLQIWKKKSMESCNYKCVLTGSKNFEIHHLYGFSNILNELLIEYPQYIDKLFSELSENDLSFILEKFIEKHNSYPLGVCVDKKLHILFHRMYGQYYNTEEQWKQFCKDYKAGKYKEYV